MIKHNEKDHFLYDFFSMRKLFYLALAILLAFWTFRPVERFSKDRPHDERWNVHSLDEQEKHEIGKILDQKFTYTSRGAQAFVFFSEDRNYVLKLFRKSRFEAPWWVHLVPGGFHYKKKKVDSKTANLIKDFTSYQLAFDHLKEETGLLLVHLNASNNFQKTVSLVEGSKEFKIELDRYDYILQKRGELVCPTIEQFLENNDLASAKTALRSLLEVFRTRLDKGIADHEPNIGKNFAFIGAQALEIDVGRFSLDHAQPPVIRSEFKSWLRSKSPELLTYFDEQYDNIFPETHSL
jgi:hypothetical protein